MARMDDALAEAGLDGVRMLLQVHDELVFEAPNDEVEPITKLVKKEMEQVHPLEVPMIVEIGVGENWRDAK